MRGVKRVTLVLILLLTTLVILTFVLENQQDVALSFLGWTTVQMPVSVFVTLSLIAGTLIGPLLGMLFRRNPRRPLASSGR